MSPRVRVLAVLAVSAMIALMFVPSITFAVASSGMTSESRFHSFVCPTNSCSTNWGGYAVTGAAGSVSYVAGSWTVTAVSCPKRGSSYAAFWVGIDGYSSSTVEQTGTLAQCSNGVATYSAWYEFYPNPMYTISALTVSPGNTITANVQFTGGSKFVATITDVTTGKTSSNTASVASAQRSSAEWIAEAPSSNAGVLPLANFGTASFGSSNTATISGVTQAIGLFPTATVWQITMITNRDAVKAQPSSLATDHSSFTVTWQSTGP